MKVISSLSTSGLFLIILFLAACSEVKEHDLVISNVNLIDVNTGEIIPKQTIAIDADTISKIYDTKIAFSDSTRIFDGTNKYLIPGLWDMHVHHNWNYKDSNPLLIVNGVLGVREMWGNMYVHNRLQKLKNDSLSNVPDVYTGSIIIDGKPEIWPGSIGVANAEEARKATLEQIESGVDFIKVYTRLSRKAFNSIARTANEHDVPFVGHVPSRISIYDAIEAGMSSSEHLTGILEACSSMPLDSMLLIKDTSMLIEKLLETFDEAKFDSLSTALAKSEMWLCPTLTVLNAFGRLNDSSFINDDRLNYLPDFYEMMWDPTNDFRFQSKKNKFYDTYRKGFEFQLKLLGKMEQKGVKILAGTDFPNPYCFPGFSLHDELALLVEGGLTELAAIQASTINAAKFMGKENEFGTVETGKIASLVLLSENPLENIKNTKEIDAVILRGKLLDKATLDTILKEVKVNLKKPVYSEWLYPCIIDNGIGVALDSLDLLLSAKNSAYKLEESDINTLGYKLMESGDLNSALKIFEKNIELFPDEYNVYDSYAEALLKSGDMENSLINYQKALELNPYSTSTKLMIDSLSL